MESQREPHLIGYKKKVPPSPHACKTQLVRESCQNCKRREKKDGAVHIGLFQEMLCPAYATRCLHLCNSFILHTETYSSEWIHFAVLNTTVFACKLPFTDLQGFWPHFSAKKRAKSVSAEKNVGQKNTDHIYFKLIWSCSFSTHDLHLQNIVQWCKSGFLELITWFTPLQNLFCTCKFILRLQCHLHFHKYYPAHANLFDIILSS